MEEMSSPATAKTILVLGPGNKTKSVAVINPIFAACLSHIKDPFWIETFEKAAQGKFHKGFGYANGCLTFKKKTKICRLEHPDAPHEAASAIIQFYETVGNVMSVADIKKHHEQMQTVLKQDQGSDYNEWKNIKRSAIKQQLIGDFVDRLLTKYEIAGKGRELAIQTIKGGFTKGCFSSSNIVMKNSRIDHVNGLSFDAKGKKFVVDPSCKPKKASKSRSAKAAESSSLELDVKVSGVSKRENKVIPFLEVWSKFIEEQEKQIAHINRLRINDTKSLEGDVSIGVQSIKTPITSTPLIN